MPFEKLSDRVRQLIGENEQRAAADLLLQAFRDKNPQLYNIALMQQADIKKLADQGAAGILSTDEFNRMQAKINAALLHLSDEHARLFESGKVATDVPRWVFVAVGAVIVLLLAGWLVQKALAGADKPDTFDLEVYVHDAKSEATALAEGTVNLRIGEKMRQNAQTLDANGRAVFQELSGKYLGDSVHLVYKPLRDRRFKITAQSATLLSTQPIRFAIEFLPDTTLYEASLRNEKGRPIVGAKITVDGNLNATSDANGYFKIAIPKAVNSTSNFVIEKNGTRLYGQDLTVRTGLQSISIDEK